MTPTGPVLELPWIWAGLAAYLLAQLWVMAGLARIGAPAGASVARGYERHVLLLLAIGVALLAVALAQRWIRIGHGPFVNMFELLVSQTFSLGLIFSLIYWRFPVLRPSAVVVIPVMFMLGAWALLVGPADMPLPPTYYNNWLWAHVGFGKVFLSFCLVGAGLGGVILLRSAPRLAAWFRHMPNDAALELFAWRFMMVAFVFESLMLIAGAVWAQDAWGRYWSWDPLETSAFLNWLVLGFALHARIAYRIPTRVGAVLMLVIFGFAFMTYFGTPFVSEAIHKGVV